MGQDRSFEPLEIAAGFEPKLLDQPTPGAAVALKRIGMATRAVQREHQLTDEALAQGMLVDERLELSDQPGVLAERELRVYALLDSAQPCLLQPRDLRLRERLVGKIRQRWTTPQPQRLPQPPGRALRLTLLKRTSAFSDERLKAVQVSLARLGLEQIRPPTGD